jgi:hypothetical protein
LIKFGISGKSPHLTLVYWKGCFLKVHRLTLARLYRRTLGRQSHVSRIQGVPRGGVDNIWDENQQAVHRPHLPIYPEYNSVSTIRIRLQKVIKCLGLLNILFWKFEYYSLSCIRGKTVPCSPERNSVSIIRIRLREVIRCLAFNDFSQTNSNNTHWVSFGGTR